MISRGKRAFPRSILEDALGDRNISFVFPSEVAADSWARAAPSRLGAKAVESDRFLGWDSFKALLFSRRGSGRPADGVARIIWAAGVAARQAAAPFLERILGPARLSEGQGAGVAFVPFLASLPPALSSVARASSRLPGDDALRDLIRLRDDYASFLDEHGLFEPAWEALPAPSPGNSYIIIAPELIEDFEEYAEAIAALPAVSLARLPRPESPPELAGFDGCYDEYRWALLSIGELLDSGVNPEDIALTVPDIEASAPYVLRAAEIAGVPLSLKRGSTLAQSPFGRLLEEISACSSRGFAFDALRDLLLDRFAVWNRADEARGLIRFGIDKHAVASFADRGKNVDIWRLSFKACGAPRSLVDFYRDLRRRVERISTARTFASLRAAIMEFRRELLDESGLGKGEELRLQKAIDELNKLVQMEERLGPGELPSPLELFLKHLEDIPYVPQESGAAVPVYPYRVSALVAARDHFVLGCSQEGASVSYARARFLREDQKEALGLADRDASADFASAYTVSGDVVRFSYSAEALGGWTLPHPYFLGREGNPRRPDAERELALDPQLSEGRAWASGAALPGRLPRAELAAAASLAAAPIAGAAERYAQQKCAGVEARRAALGSATRPDGELRLSASEVEDYLACPFAWLLARALKLEAQEAGVGFFDALLAGEMGHAAVRELFAAIESSGPFSSLKRQEYEAAIGGCIDAVLPSFVEREGPFLEPMFRAYAPLLADRLSRLLEAESWMEGWEAGDFELPLERAYPAIGVVLAGRLDRLARRGLEHGIIDYKKRALPRVKDLRAEEGALGDLQIAAYVALCEANGLEATRAAYWSIEDAKRLVVLGPGGLAERKDYEPELAALGSALGETALALRAGDFAPPDEEVEACDGCRWKGLCRRRFSAEGA